MACTTSPQRSGGGRPSEWRIPLATRARVPEGTAMDTKPPTAGRAKSASTARVPAQTWNLETCGVRRRVRMRGRAWQVRCELQRRLAGPPSLRERLRSGSMARRLHLRPRPRCAPPVCTMPDAERSPLSPAVYLPILCVYRRVRRVDSRQGGAVQGVDGRAKKRRDSRGGHGYIGCLRSAQGCSAPPICTSRVHAICYRRRRHPRSTSG
ncbi:hypothetical protein C2E23DRAFT_285635 [Lenzites betulinus]|nr:hypothetical protein C2E23DRAFT_285635 [Lenzites betulinus]